MNKRYTVSEVIDGFGVSKFTWKFFWTVFFANVCNGFNYMLVAFTMAQMAIDWSLTPVEKGSLSSWSLAGVIIGGMFGGIIADKIGRKKTLVYGMIWYSIFTLPIFFIDSFNTFAVLRVISGMGVGACFPIVSTFNSEFTPTKSRTIFVTLGMAGMLTGWCVAGLFGIVVVPNLGWRVMYICGGLPLLYAIFLHFMVPESPHWLVSKGLFKEAIEVLKLVERKSTGKVSEWNPEGLIIPPKPEKVGVGVLFSKIYIGKTISLWVMYFIGCFIIYGITIWMPSLLIEKGLSTGSSYALSTAQNAAAAIAAMLVGVVSAKVGPRVNCVVSFVIAAVSVVIMSLVSGGVGVVLLACIFLGFMCNYAMTTIPPVVVATYRTEVRATGMAWCQSIGRIAGTVAPIVAGIVVSMGYTIQQSLLFYVLPCLLAAVIGFFAYKETNEGVSFDEVAQKDIV